MHKPFDPAAAPSREIHREYKELRIRGAGSHAAPIGGGWLDKQRLSHAALGDVQEGARQL